MDFIYNELVGETPTNIYEPQNMGKDRVDFNADIKDLDNYMPVATTMTLLNTILGNNTLLEGSAGTAKTRLASVIGSIVHQIPFEMYERRRIVGSPGATPQDTYACHDIAQVAQGKDVAYIYLQAAVPCVIIDEVNRFSPLSQNMIREGIAAGVWPYANHSFKVEDQVVISCINPESYGGTNELNENLVDNYAITLIAPEFHAMMHKDLVETADERTRTLLGLENEVDDLEKFYKENKNDFEAVKKRIKQMQEKTVQAYEERGVPFINNGTISSIADEIKSVKFTAEAELFFYAAYAEMTYSKKFGRLRHDDPISDEDEDKNYLVCKIAETLRGRFLKDWRNTARALAWYLEKNPVKNEDENTREYRVGIDELKAAFIYASARRIKPHEGFENDVYTSKNEARRLSKDMEIARRAIQSVHDNFTDFQYDNVSGEETATFQELRNAMLIIKGQKEGKLSDAIATLQAAEHPLSDSVLEAIFINKYEDNRLAKTGGKKPYNLKV